MATLLNIDFEFYIVTTLFLFLVLIFIWKFTNWIKVLYGYCIFAVLVIFSFFDSLFKKINNFSFFVSFLGNVIYPFIDAKNYNPTKVYLKFKSKIITHGAIDHIYSNPEPLTKNIITDSFKPKYSEELIKILMDFKRTNSNDDEIEYWHQIYFGQNAILGTLLKQKIQDFENNTWKLETIIEKLNYLKHHIFNDFKTWHLDSENIPYLSLAIEKLENIKFEMTKKPEPIPIQIQESKLPKPEKPALIHYFKNPDDIVTFEKAIELLKNTEFEGFKTKNLPENYYILLFNIFEESNFLNENWLSIKNNKKRKLELLNPIFGKEISRGFVNDLLAEYEPNRPENKIYSTQLIMKAAIEKIITN